MLRSCPLSFLRLPSRYLSFISYNKSSYPLASTSKIPFPLWYLSIIIASVNQRDPLFFLFNYTRIELNWSFSLCSGSVYYCILLHVHNIL